MTCAHLTAIEAGCDTAFTVDASRLTFGHGALAEVGPRIQALGATRVALFTDQQVGKLPWFAEVLASLTCDVAVFDAVEIEPTDSSLAEAIRFARDAGCDGYVSLGGGSVIDTCKIANLYATYPADLRAYVNAPLGDAKPIPGPLAPHVACPTTSGTGSEVTGIAIFDWHAHRAKTGISSPHLRPTEAVVDPRVTHTLPPAVVAASGLDVLCHAIESFTARAFTSRPKTPVRPASQGANPWSDLGCREAMRLCGAHLANAVAGDQQAREQMMWAATLAGIAFGNAGVHVPHAMAYAIAGQVKTWRAPGYPDAPLIPHGMAVALGAPSAFRFLDHVHNSEAAQLLGGHDLAETFIALMAKVGAPAGCSHVGYTAADIPALVDGAFPQQRLLANAPRAITRDDLAAMFTGALAYG